MLLHFLAVETIRDALCLVLICQVLELGMLKGDRVPCLGVDGCIFVFSW